MGRTWAGTATMKTSQGKYRSSNKQGRRANDGGHGEGWGTSVLLALCWPWSEVPGFHTELSSLQDRSSTLLALVWIRSFSRKLEINKLTDSERMHPNFLKELQPLWGSALPFCEGNCNCRRVLMSRERQVPFPCSKQARKFRWTTAFHSLWEDDKPSTPEGYI